MTSRKIESKKRPGHVRDAILTVLASSKTTEMTLAQISTAVAQRLGEPVSASSIRSSLNLNVGKGISRVDRGVYALTKRIDEKAQPDYQWGGCSLFLDDCFEW